MTQEDKQLLLKDLCARLPYRVIAYASEINKNGIITDVNIPYNMVNLTVDNDSGKYELVPLSDIKPYLRPMSSMTDEERTKIASMAGHFNDLTKAIEVCFACLPVVDYCYSRHLDIHGLIEKGLALEAPKDMYKKESLQPHWKPSEEQIYAIVEALKYLPNNKDEWMILNTLADILRKLM